MPTSVHPHPSPAPASLTVGSDEVTFQVTSEESAGALVAFAVRMPPGGGPPMLHRHDAFELYRVEGGELTFYLEHDPGKVRRSVSGPGGLVPIPGGREHTIRNESSHEARAFVVLSPGSEMELFIREAGALAARGESGVPAVLPIASAHGAEITRPVEGAV